MNYLLVLLLIIVLLTQQFCFINNCQLKIQIGLICINQQYNPQELSVNVGDQNISLILVGLIGKINLSLAIPDRITTPFHSVFIKHCCLVDIQSKYFAKLGALHNLELIDISCLEIIKQRHLSDLNNSLEHLTINANSVKSIEPDALMELIHLKYLSIYGTQIKVLPSSLFLKLNLIAIDLQNNRLGFLPVFPGPTSRILNSFKILGNNWTCDCSMEIYRLFVRDFDFFQAKCASPSHLVGKKMCDIPSMCKTAQFSRPQINRPHQHSKENPTTTLTPLIIDIDIINSNQDNNNNTNSISNVSTSSSIGSTAYSTDISSRELYTVTPANVNYSTESFLIQPNSSTESKIVTTKTVSILSTLTSQSNVVAHRTTISIIRLISSTNTFRHGPSIKQTYINLFIPFILLIFTVFFIMIFIQIFLYLSKFRYPTNYILQNV